MDIIKWSYLLLDVDVTGWLLPRRKMEDDLCEQEALRVRQDWSGCQKCSSSLSKLFELCSVIAAG